MAAPYLDWPETALQFLLLRAAGLPITDALKKIKSRVTGRTGVHIDNLYHWRKIASFAHAEREMLDDPTYIHRMVANPMKIAWNDVRDLEMLMADKEGHRGLSAKKLELTSQEMGLTQPETSKDRFAEMVNEYKKLMAQAPPSLPAPTITVIDVRPTPERVDADPPDDHEET